MERGRRLARWGLTACLVWVVLLLASRPAAADPAQPCQLGEPGCELGESGQSCSAAEQHGAAGQQRLAELASERLCDSELVFPEDGITAVPFCLDDEASAVAPLPLLAVADSRIMAPLGCPSQLGSTAKQLLQRYTSGPDDQQSDQQSDSPDKAMIPPVAHQPAAPALLKLDHRLRRSTGPEGYRLRIYRPPRGR